MCVFWLINSKPTRGRWVSGLCGKPFKFDALEMAQKLGLERRVPLPLRGGVVYDRAWTGYTLSKLVKQAEPKASAKYVKFYTAMKPAEIPGLALASISLAIHQRPS